MAWVRMTGKVKSELTSGVAINIDMNGEASASFTVPSDGLYSFFASGIKLSPNKGLWMVKINGIQIKTVDVHEYKYVSQPTIFNVELNAGDVISVQRTNTDSSQGFLLCYTYVK